MMADDELDRRLRELPDPQPGGDVVARARRRALAVLAEERRLARSPLLRLWSRALMPAVVVGTCGAYLVWALLFAASLYQ
jgi:hypothetical protein